MEKILILWIEDCNRKRIPLSTSIIKEKSGKLFNLLREETSSDEIFKRSNGWFLRFKERFSLHNLKLSGEKASADEESGNRFKVKLSNIIKDGDYLPEQVFNADESGLFWKKMPDRTFISKEERTASGFKASKDRITVMLCTNSSGTCKFKPLLLNKFLNPRAMRGVIERICLYIGKLIQRHG